MTRNSRHPYGSERIEESALVRLEGAALRESCPVARSLSRITRQAGRANSEQPN